MSDYTINDLRGDLAATIRALRNGDKDMTVEKAKAIGDLSQTMINSAKVEVDMVRALGRDGAQPTGFLSIEGKSVEGKPVESKRAAPPADLLPAPERPRPRPHVYNPVGDAPRGTL